MDRHSESPHTHLDQSAEFERLQRCVNDLTGLLAGAATWSNGGPPQPVVAVLDALAAANEGLSREMGERRSTEDALRESIRDARLVVDEIPAFVSLLTATGEVQLINRQIFDYTGKTAEELRGWSGSDLVHADDRERAIESFRKGMARGEPFEIHYRMRRFDGVYRWFHGRHRPLRDSEGHVVRWLVAVTDVDDRRHAEEALRESELRARAVIDGIPGLVAIMTPAGGIETVNRQILEYTGQSLEELKNWGTNGTVHPDDLPHVAKVFGESIAAGVPYDIEQRLRRFDGAYRWFGNRGVPARDSSGAIVCWHVLLTDIEARKHAEEALRASERESRLMVDSINGMIAQFTPEGELSGGNRQLLDYFRQPLEEVARWATNGITHPDDLQTCIDSFTRSLRSGEPYEFETRFRRHDGVYRWFQLRGLPLHDAEGRIVRWYGLLTDIEDKKRAEEALRVNERNLQLIIDTIPAMAWSALPDGTVDFFNKHYLDYVGLAADQVDFWNFTVAVHPDDRPALLASIEATLASGEPGEVEARLRRFDGEFRWFLFRTNPLRDESGEIVRWYGTNTDIDDRKRAEEKVRLSEAFLADAQRVSRTGSFSWRVESNELTWSEEAYRIYGFDPAKPVNFDLIRQRVHPDNLPMLQDVMEQVRREGGDFDYETRLLMPDKSIKYLRVVAHSDRGRSGELELVGAVQDVTEQRLAEEALSKARSELAHVARITSLSALTASIAHEVNQPLAGIITNASTCLRMLASDPPNVAGARETARRTIRDGNRAADVITRLRALFAKRDAADDAVDLNDATQEVIALSLGDFQRNGVVLRVELAEELPLVTGDRVQLQQVVLNLLRNASEAMSGIEHRLRRLTIRTVRDEGGGVRLTVQDSGTGLDLQARERLFEAFQTTKLGGMGIGLSLSRSIIERHRGRLWLESSDGSGATFALSIPARAEGDSSLVSQAAEFDSTQGRPSTAGGT